MKEELKIFNKQVNDSEKMSKLDALNSLTEYYMFRDLKRASSLCQDAIEASKSVKDNDKLAQTFYNLANNHRLNNNIEEASLALKEAFSHLTKNNIRTRIKLYRLISLIYAYLHIFDKASDYAHQAFELSKEEHLDIEIFQSLKTIGRVHYHLQEYDITEYYYDEAYKLAKNLDQEESAAYLALYVLRNKLRLFNTDIESYLQHIEHYIDESNNLTLLGVLKVYWGVYYILNDDVSYGKASYQMGLEIIEEEKMHPTLLQAYLSLTHALEYKNKDDKAEKLYLKAVEYFEKNHLKLDLPKLYLAVSQFYSKQGNISLYQMYLRKYVAIKEELDSYMSRFF